MKVKQLTETFRFRIIGSFLIILLPTLIVMAVAVEYFFIPSMRQNIKEELTNPTRVLVGSIHASADALVRNHLKAIAEKNREIASQHLTMVDQGLLTREEAINRLKSIILSQQIGSSGYIYCLDHTGIVVVHPNKDVENSDNTGFEFVREQLVRKEGYLEYDWQNPGEKSSRPKALYMVYFEPLDWIISVSSYRSEFYELLDPNDFHEAVSSLQFGESGYACVFTKEGKVLIHPNLPYLADLSQVDSDSDIVDQMLSQGSGIIEYVWRNPDDATPRKKIAVFESIPEYGWTVVSSAYLDEVMAPINLIKKLGYISIFFASIAAAVATFFLSGRLSKPIDAMMSQLDQNTKSGNHIPLPVYSHDELGRLAQEFNSFFRVLETQSEQLRKERERYQSLFESSPDAIFLLRGLTIIDCNQATCDLFAGNKNKMLGLTLVDLSPPSQFQGESSLLLAEQLTNQSQHCNLQAFDWIHKAIDGRLFFAEVRLKFFGVDEGELLLVAFVRDITERKRAEEALLLTQFSFDRAAIGIFQIGNDAQVLNANEQACKDLGYSKSELCQMTIFDFNPNADVNDWEGIWQKLRDQKKDNFETEHRRKDGTIIPVEITSNLLEFDGNQYSFSFVRDITERKNNAKLKAKMQAQLQQVQRLDSLGTLAGGIAHDFNNILSAIVGYTELTKLGCSDNPKVLHYLDQLSSASLRAKDLVQQILNFSRQSGSEKHPIDISRIVNEALKLIRATIPTTIEISKNVPSDLGVVVANETQLHQIVMNLCTNAHHAIGNEGGSIDVDLITTTISAKDEMNYPDLDPGEYLKLIITDTGSGIPAEILPNIFDPYFTTKDPGEGTGLGLSTVHGIVKDHGGSIKAYSEPGNGTSFQIFLPIIETEPEKNDNSVEQLPHGIETILFVDDEKLLLEIGKELLESLGYRVETRASSIDALEAFRVQPAKYDLIVSDITMPKMTGEYLAMEIKKIAPDVPIILCTGFSTRLNSEKLIKIGVAKVLMKPLTMSELAVNVRLALDHI
ncbi:MAG: cache domain-containing protein [Proteobacteria bacterium]|nr:cache domain-containing protein [Pseudomonadota bacterium]MBU1419443.1 cache domain-containing protein [Pseudomonadota bacterium]MBU1454043.1 cache domain-containing protein [Pseudomonadota bacterium]